MLYELKVCLRYLRPRRSSAYISINTIISIVGIAVGIMTLIVVMGVMTGFGDNLKNRFVGLFSHIQVLGEGAISDYPDVQNAITDIEHVQAASPYVTGQLSMKVGNKAVPLRFWGVDPVQERQVSDITRRYMQDGEFDLTDIEGDALALVLGSGTAESYGLEIGDRVWIASTALTITGQHAARYPARVTGIFKSGIVQQDFGMAYVSLVTGQSFQGLNQDFVYDDNGVQKREASGQIAGFSVKLDHIDNADAVKLALQKKLDTSYTVKSWKDLNRPLYAAIEQEKTIMYIILTLIIAVAALNIISSLTMTVMHRRREIGVLKAMGSSRSSIMTIFALEGLVIGVLGITSGIIGGLLIAHNINPIADWVADVTRTERLFSSEIFYLEAIPVNISSFDIALVAVIALGLCVVASVYPAFRAGRLNPVEVLRYE